MAVVGPVWTIDPDPVVRDPAICGGEPTIRGTRIPVRSVVIQWKHYRDIERVRHAFPRLSPSLIQYALGYYLAHQEEIDRLIAASADFASSTD